MKARNLLLRLTLQTIIMLMLMAGLLFAGAGTWRWPEAWAYLAIFVSSSAGFGLWLNRHDPDLLAARLASPLQRGQPLWDKLFLSLFMLLWFVWMVAMGWDHRQHPHALSWAWEALGAVLVLAGFLGVCRVFAENSFAAPVVRVQIERSQRVIDSGPYALVRHPMYAAAILYVLGIALLLGSVNGLWGAVSVLAGVMARSVMEEKVLLRELPGYAAYRKRVRYRIIPGIW